MTQSIHVYTLQEQDQELKHDEGFARKQAQDSGSFSFFPKN